MIVFSYTEILNYEQDITFGMGHAVKKIGKKMQFAHTSRFTKNYSQITESAVTSATNFISTISLYRPDGQ